jgi:POT family proton-dependent oligopeptide transporter
VNAFFIVLLGPIFAWMWVKLDAAGKNPSIPAKFAMGLIGMGLGFAVINLGIAQAGPDAKVMWYFLAGLYFVHTCGELCLSPVGLSMVTKLAPERMTGMVMGAWFISIATGNFVAGKISSLAAREAGRATTEIEKVQAYGTVFHYVLIAGVGLGMLFLILSPVVNRKLHGVK